MVCKSVLWFVLMIFIAESFSQDIGSGEEEPCIDVKPDCEILDTSLGETIEEACLNDIDNKIKYCRSTCGFCECKDFVDGCDISNCEEDYGDMRNVCRKTCGECVVDETVEEVREFKIKD